MRNILRQENFFLVTNQISFLKTGITDPKSAIHFRAGLQFRVGRKSDSVLGKREKPLIVHAHKRPVFNTVIVSALFRSYE